MRQVGDRHFITGADQLRATELPSRYRGHPDTRRFSFSPLHGRPVVRGVINDLLIPVPGLIVRKASPLGLYYTGVAHWGNPFARDVGTLFEAYVGRQLRQLHGAAVHPAITYTVGKDKRDSVDWFAVFDDVTLLVEVKSTRPTESVRTGSDTAVDDLARSLAKAVRQINTSAQLVRDQHPAFRHVPHDRPIIGLVVTMEPFHVINAPMYRDLLPAGSEPVRFCSAYELEGLVTVEDDTAGTLLRGFVHDPHRQDWPILELLRGHTVGRNEVLDAAWQVLPWQGSRQSDAT
jgi:hypothetical protein